MKYFILIGCFFVVRIVYAQAISEKLSKDYFQCKGDSECTLVSGWCSYFAINKKKLPSFNKIPESERNPKNTCPPGWVPMELPKPVCIKNQCSTAGGKPGL